MGSDSGQRGVPADSQPVFGGASHRRMARVHLPHLACFL